MITLDKCPICGDTEPKEFITDKGDKFTEEKEWFCVNCGLGFLSPRMDDDELKEYYSSNSFRRDFRRDHDINRQVLFDDATRRWGLVEPYLFGGTLLDIGCSSGEFLEIAHNSGKFDGVYGIDSTPEDVNLIRFGTTYVGSFPEYSFPEVDKFDTICTYQTLEHTSDPQAFLDAVYERLDDDGVFILEYPDLNLAATRTVLHDTYFQKSHLYDFSVFNLILLLGKAGFRVNFAGIPQREVFPRDKNALVVCAKSEKGKREYSPDKYKARVLLKLMRKHMRHININFGRPMQILHIASHHINVGDGAINQSIRTSIPHVSGAATTFQGIDIVDYYLKDDYFTAEKLEAHNPDLIIVGGGGVIDGHKHRRRTGTAFDMPLGEIEKLKTPLAFVGLGYNLFPGQEFYHADELNTFLEFCRDENIPFSVRRDGSWERLHDLVDDDLMEYVDIIPDPGFFIEAEKGNSPYLSPLAERNIVLQLATDVVDHRYGGVENLHRFLDIIAKWILWVIRKYHVHITLATHTLDDSLSSVVLLNDALPRQARRLYTKITGVYHPVYAAEFYRVYANADMVVGMREHSVICSTGLAIPTIALSSHAKVEGYMKEVNALNWTIPALSENLFVELKNMTDNLAEDPKNQLARIAEATKTWRTDYYDFLAKVLRKV